MAIAIGSLLGRGFSTAGKAVGGAARTIGKGTLAVGGGLLAGLGSGLLGGKLGGSGSSRQTASPQQQQTSYPRISSIFAPTSTNTRVTGPTSIKDNCCCCDQTISLLSSIDETLKRSLYVSQAMNLAAREKAAEGGDNQKIAGLGGKIEAMADNAEKAGFGIGEMLAQSIGLAIVSNLGPILDFLKPGGDLLKSSGGNNTPNVAGAGIGGAIGYALGGKRKIVSAGIGAVAGSDVLGDGLYKAKSDEGFWGGLAGNVGGGMAGAAAGAQLGLVGGPVGAFFGGLIGGIAGSFLLEDAGEALGDAMAGKFNEETDGKKIGKDAADEMKKRLGSSGAGLSSNIGIIQSSKDASSLKDLIGRIESGNNPDVFRKGGRAVYGVEVSKLSIDQVMQNQKTSGWDAVGKFQFIPSTLKMLSDEMKKMGMITGKEKFDEGMQDKFFQYQISKMSNVQKFLGGDQSAKQAAMIDLSKIWAALPDPRTGKSFYEGDRSGNKALTDLATFSKMMDVSAGTPNVVLATPKPISDVERMALAAAAPKPAPASAPTVINNTMGSAQKSQKQIAYIPPIDPPKFTPKAVSQFESNRYLSV